MTPEKIRLQALRAAIEMRTATMKPEDLVVLAKTFETFIAGDKRSDPPAGDDDPK